MSGISFRGYWPHSREQNLLPRSYRHTWPFSLGRYRWPTLTRAPSASRPSRTRPIPTKNWASTRIARHLPVHMFLLCRISPVQFSKQRSMHRQNDSSFQWRRHPHPVRYREPRLLSYRRQYVDLDKPPGWFGHLRSAGWLFISRFAHGLQYRQRQHPHLGGFHNPSSGVRSNHRPQVGGLALVAAFISCDLHRPIFTIGHRPFITFRTSVPKAAIAKYHYSLVQESDVRASREIRS